MSTFILCADFASAGRLLGCDLACDPDEWDETLGGSDWPLVDVRKGRMRRDYGLVEILFERQDAGWECVDVSLHIHRLESEHEDLVPPGLRNIYGPIEGAVPFSSVTSELNARRVRYEVIADRDQLQYVRYWIEESAVIITVRGAEARNPGAVWSVSKPSDAGVWRRPQK